MMKMFSKMNEKLVNMKENNRYTAEFNSVNDSQNQLMGSFHQDDMGHGQNQSKYIKSPSSSESSIRMAQT